MSGSSSHACPVDPARGGVPLTISVRHTSAAAIQGSTTFLLKLSTSIMASATPAASAPRHSTSALEARSMRGLQRDAEGSHVAETVSEANALPLGFRMVRSDVRIHSPGRFRIGEVAYCVWAFPPNVGGTARHVQVHSHMTSSIDKGYDPPLYMRNDARCLGSLSPRAAWWRAGRLQPEPGTWPRQFWDGLPACPAHSPSRRSPARGPPDWHI